MESGPLHSQAGSGTLGAGDLPVGGLKSLLDVFALDLEQGRGTRGLRSLGDVEFRQGHAEDGAGRENDSAFHEVFELADVSRPGIAFEGFHGFRGNGLDAAVHSARIHLDEETDEQGNVFGALAEGRDADGEDVEAVVEVAAELAIGHHCGEIAIGGGDDACIDADGAVAAEAFEFLLLEDAEELGLQLGRDVADFIEENGAAVGEFESADLLGNGAGEGSFLVAEELAFEQAGGDSGAVNLHEGSAVPAAEIVDGAGHAFLAGAGFAEEQDGRIGGGDGFHLFEDVAKGGAFTDHFLELVTGAHLVFEDELLLGEAILEILNLAVGERVFEGDGELHSDLAEEFHVCLGEGAGTVAGQIESAEDRVAGEQGEADAGIETFGEQQTGSLRVQLFQRLAVKADRLALPDGFGGRDLIDGKHHLVANQALPGGEIQGVEADSARTVLFQQSEAGVLVMEEVAAEGGDGGKNIGELEIGDDGVVYLQQEAQAVAFASQFGLSRFRGKLSRAHRFGGAFRYRWGNRGHKI